jgi:hypothetical protein
MRFQRHRARSWRELFVSPPVNLSTVADLHDFDGPAVVIDGVDDAVIPLADPIALFSGELLMPGRARILSQCPNAVNDSA